MLHAMRQRWCAAVARHTLPNAVATRRASFMARWSCQGHCQPGQVRDCWWYILQSAVGLMQPNAAMTEFPGSSRAHPHRAKNRQQAAELPLQ